MNTLLLQFDAMQTKPKQFKEDLIKRKKTKAFTNDPVSRLTDLVRDGVKLGFSIAGENTTDFDEKTMKVISPRFLSVIPEDADNDTVH